VIQKIIGPTTIWSGEAFASFKNASALVEANVLFDIVDMFEEREMRTAESWLSWKQERKTLAVLHSFG